MPEMHLRQPIVLGKPEIQYNACELFTENQEQIQKFKETGKIYLLK